MICVEDIDLDAVHILKTPVAKRAQNTTYSRSGRYVRAAPVDEHERDFKVAVDATLRAARVRQSLAGEDTPFAIAPQDLHKKVFKRPGQTLIVFLVDASDSMGQGTYARMKAAKGAALAVLAKARLKRHRVAMVAFRDRSAQVVLPPTASVALAQQHLKTLATGGATPFGHGLMAAWQLVRAERHKAPHLKPLLIILSDGEANVPYNERHAPMGVMNELLQICGHIGRDHIPSIVIDTQSGMSRSGSMQRIATSLKGTFHHVHHLKARHLVGLMAAR